MSATSIVTVEDLLAAPTSELITLPQLADEMGVAPPTTWRWALRGIDGERMVAVKRGGKWRTTLAAARCFHRRLTAKASGEQVGTVPASRERAVDAADRDCGTLLR